MMRLGGQIDFFVPSSVRAEAISVRGGKSFLFACKFFILLFVCFKLLRYLLVFLM